jgi:hypothetical protein
MMRRRLEFSAETKRQACERSGDICECYLIPWLKRPKGCGAKLGIGNADAISGRNDLDNCAVLCRTCWREKTDRYDRKVIAKSNHIRDLARGIRQIPFRPLPGTVALGIKLPMRGEPHWRDSGKPVWRRP